MNTMMNNHQLWTDGHHKADHDLMDALIGDHNLIRASLPIPSRKDIVLV